jgi:hypothetical protein
MALINYMTGGGLPPTQVPNATNPGMPQANALGGPFQMTQAPFAGRDYNAMIQGSLESFMNPNSQYIKNARQEGAQYAQQRGGINSSIAAGASEKEALGAAVPLAQSAVASQLGQEQAQLSNWMDTQGFNRQMNAMPYQNSMNMLTAVTQMGLQDPQLYSPSVISGFSNFFNQNMNDMLKSYFK